ncbi:LOW QUALITY PROTEIN: haloalkane dehalogenase-like, partial [Telopea speciosissima]|uniref:LOW QUALITY PROTEIN: haloalkane dehalogenase-like n=1 Tax=Telopea speciosissima TaxID=54955 RepID=UPI001CC390E6
QAYSYRKVLPVLTKDYHAIAFDWLGFGFSDKPKPRYGFDYTLDEYVSSLDALILELVEDKVSIVVQGYFAPVVVKYANNHQDRLNDLILLNFPLMDNHANLPSTLSIFSNYLLGEIFSQDPLRASDKALTSCGLYKMKEEDAMVYRRPEEAVDDLCWSDEEDTISSEDWKVWTTVCWGQRDCWLSYDGVEDFCKSSNHKLVELPMAGHHVQEDSDEELGHIISRLISRRH